MLKAPDSAKEIVSQISAKKQEDELSYMEVIHKDFSFELIFYKDYIQDKEFITIKSKYGTKQNLRPLQWLEEYFQEHSDKFLNKPFEIK